jgi:hypothetical protein
MLRRRSLIPSAAGARCAVLIAPTHLQAPSKWPMRMMQPCLFPLLLKLDPELLGEQTAESPRSRAQSGVLVVARG